MHAVLYFGNLLPPEQVLVQADQIIADPHDFPVVLTPASIKLDRDVNELLVILHRIKPTRCGVVIHRLVRRHTGLSDDIRPGRTAVAVIDHAAWPVLPNRAVVDELSQYRFTGCPEGRTHLHILKEESLVEVLESGIGHLPVHIRIFIQQELLVIIKVVEGFGRRIVTFLDDITGTSQRGVVTFRRGITRSDPEAVVIARSASGIIHVDAVAEVAFRQWFA